jgi:hypothetical protein
MKLHKSLQYCSCIASCHAGLGAPSAEEVLLCLLLQNVVLYAGSFADRAVIRDTEFWYPKDKAQDGRMWGTRFNVLLASYETILKDKTELRKIKFEVSPGLLLALTVCQPPLQAARVKYGCRHFPKILYSPMPSPFLSLH